MSGCTETDMTIPPVPFLANLREAVLQRSTARMPKWRFRFTPDLVAQIQPKPVSMLSKAASEQGYRQYTIRFECRVVLSEEANPAMLERTPSSAKPWWLRSFNIVDEQEGVWTIFRKSGMRKRDADQDGFAILNTRFRDALASNVFDGHLGELMLAPQCLVCGKGLTDPASMARFIGPECSGTSSLLVPGLFTPTKGMNAKIDDFSKGQEAQS